MNKLRMWREAQGFTLQDVADLTGLSVAMLSRVERGERALSPRAKVHVARCVGARVSELFPPPSIDDREAAAWEVAE